MKTISVSLWQQSNQNIAKTCSLSAFLALSLLQPTPLFLAAGTTNWPLLNEAFCLLWRRSLCCWSLMREVRVEKNELTELLLKRGIQTLTVIYVRKWTCSFCVIAGEWFYTRFHTENRRFTDELLHLCLVILELISNISSFPYKLWPVAC